MPETCQDSAYKAPPIDKSADFDGIFGNQLSASARPESVVSDNFLTKNWFDC